MKLAEALILRSDLQKRLEQRENSFSQKLIDLQEKQQKLYDKVNEVQEIKEKIPDVKLLTKEVMSHFKSNYFGQYESTKVIQFIKEIT